MNATLTDAETIELNLEDRDGNQYRGRITGKLIASNERNDLEVYLTDDERIILYDGGKLDYWEVEDVENELSEALEADAYADVCRAVGITPVIDI